jgi:hypothetical protein
MTMDPTTTKQQIQRHVHNPSQATKERNIPGGRDKRHSAAPKASGKDKWRGNDNTRANPFQQTGPAKHSNEETMLAP